MTDFFKESKAVAPQHNEDYETLNRNLLRFLACLAKEYKTNSFTRGHKNVGAATELLIIANERLQLVEGVTLNSHDALQKYIDNLQWVGAMLRTSEMTSRAGNTIQLTEGHTFMPRLERSLVECLKHGYITTHNGKADYIRLPDQVGFDRILEILDFATTEMKTKLSAMPQNAA